MVKQLFLSIYIQQDTGNECGNVLSYVKTLKILVLSILDKHLPKVPNVTIETNGNYSDIEQVFVDYYKTNAWYKGVSCKIA